MAISHEYWDRSRSLSPNHSRGSYLGSVHAARPLFVFEGVFLRCWELLMDPSAGFGIWDAVPL